MELFATCKKLSLNDPVIRLIRCQSKTSGDYTIHTYTVNLPKNKFEDDIYSSNPVLLKVLPRACSILVNSSGRSSSKTKGDSIISLLEGPTKFSGRTEIDEDPEEAQAEAGSYQKANTIYNHSMIIDWAKNHVLEIVETEKANGKFAICQIVTHHDQTLILCGSKNNHILTTIDGIESLLQTENDIMKSILLDIRTNYDKLLSLSDWFSQGYSIVGELCDGQHFTDGDNTISWFGLFRNGIPLDDLSIFQQYGLKSVPFSTVFTTKNDVSELDNVFLASRCKPNEGSVLRCRNISMSSFLEEKSETMVRSSVNDDTYLKGNPQTVVLVKTKSINYIVKRFTRQILLRGYKDIERLRDRFVDAQRYHGLSTEASIRITRQLYEFCMWMMEKEYPCSVLGHQTVTSVRGQLPNGFNTYWKEFLNEGNKDIVVTPNDFCSSFDKEQYLNETVLYQKRTYDNPAIVVFLQGLQGSGKSSIGDYCSKFFSGQRYNTRCEYIEQDMYWGDTNACQGALYHMISSAGGPKIIFVTRCNMNHQQYSRYLDICHRLPTVVTFFSPKTVDPFYFMISMAGIMTRSQDGDRLMVGRFDLPFKDIVTFSRTNYDSYIQQTTHNVYPTFEPDSELLEESKKAFREVNTIIEFVRKHHDLLMSRRFPIHIVCEPIIHTIKLLLDGTYEVTPDIVCPSKPIYIGAAVSMFDTGILESILDAHLVKGVTYLHHMTTHFCEKGKSPLGAYVSLNPKDCERPLGTSLSGKSSSARAEDSDLKGKDLKIPANTILPGQKLQRMINALVIRKSDGASAFRISTEQGDTKDNSASGRYLQQSLEKTYHITARIPSGLTPVVSNSFVGLTDERVKIVPMTIPVKLTGFWFTN
jgi:hypothetical protein